MRFPSRDHRAKVAITVELLIPETDSLHTSERISGDWTRNHYARLALNRAFGLSPDDTSCDLTQYEVVKTYRSKYIEGGLPLAGVTPDTTGITIISETEDHDTVSAESADPSDSDTDDAVSDAARWDFVVA